MADLNETITAAQEGCRDAFDDLVRATYNSTFTHALRLVGNHDDAHDVAQDTYLKAFRYLRGFRGDSSIGTWLHRITANCAHTVVARRRKHRTEPLIDDRHPIDVRSETDPAANVDHTDLRARLLVALDTLPPKLREVVVLRDVHDLSHDEIAERLDISVSAAKVRLHRARQKLRTELFGDGPQDSSLTNSDVAATSLAGEEQRRAGEQRRAEERREGVVA